MYITTTHKALAAQLTYQISIPTGTFSTTLHALFGKELDCASVVTATHTHTTCYKMAFDLHTIICTWDVVTTCIPVKFPFHLGCGYAQKKKKEEYLSLVPPWCICTMVLSFLPHICMTVQILRLGLVSG